jgi:branched-chain amino acid aminotransferase
MNLFILVQTDSGPELWTPPLDGTILPGVTRDSILKLCATPKFNIKTREVPVKMSDILELVSKNRIIEMFGAGTAAIVSPIKNIEYNGKDINIPCGDVWNTSVAENEGKKAGELTTKLMDEILGIQYGDIKSDWSVVID